MGVTLLTRARNRNLTTVADVKTALHITAETHDQMLEAMVRDASAAAESYTRRIFAREKVEETVDGTASNRIPLKRRPVVQVTSLLYQNAQVTSFVIEDSGAGLVRRESGYLWGGSAYPGPGWPGSSHWLGSMLVQEERAYVAQYYGGWLLPDDDMRDVNRFSVLAVDKSFNDSLGQFPLLVPGDVITTEEFVTAANNGRWTVVTATASKVTVSEAGLVDEAADGDQRTIRVQNLPGDVQRATIEAVKQGYLRRTRDDSLRSKSVGDLSLTYAEPSGGPGSEQGISYAARGLLRPYVAML